MSGNSFLIHDFLKNELAFNIYLKDDKKFLVFHILRNIEIYCNINKVRKNGQDVSTVALNLVYSFLLPKEAIQFSAALKAVRFVARTFGIVDFELAILNACTENFVNKIRLAKSGTIS